MGRKPKTESGTSRANAKNLVYQMKVTLKGITPPIWRRFQVTGDTTLYVFHGVVQTVMGWLGGHMHEFEIHGTPYGDPAESEEEVIDEGRVTLGRLIFAEKDKFLYVYDFGDNWEHEVLVEKILPIEKGTHYPVCLAGKRACPPEDCGGPLGYKELLEILMDPNHPEHDDRFDWLPGDFDSEKFDLQLVNENIGGAKRGRDPVKAIIDPRGSMDKREIDR
jgi:hypothetical protein